MDWDYDARYASIVILVVSDMTECNCFKQSTTRLALRVKMFNTNRFFEYDIKR